MSCQRRVVYLTLTQLLMNEVSPMTVTYCTFRSECNIPCLSPKRLTKLNEYGAFVEWSRSEDQLVLSVN